MLVAFMAGWQARHDNNSKTTPPCPFVSVIIPFRNEAGNLSAILDGLAAQSYAPDKFEVIMIDDHSTDGGGDIVRNFVAHTPVNLKYLKALGNGKKQAIAQGLEEATGDWILQTDADCKVQPEWIESMLSTLDEETGIILGTVKMNPGEGFWSEFAAIEFMSLQASGAALTNLGKPIMGSAANMAYRKSIWEEGKAAGNKHDSGDDVFLIQSAIRGKWKVGYRASPHAIVTTTAPGDFGALLSQRARWGSKTPSYPSLLAKGIAMFVAVYALWCLGLLIAGLFSKPVLQLFAFMLGIKAIWDYFFLKAFARDTGQKALMRRFPSAALVYPFYIAITLVAMLFPNTWKGRTIQ